MVDAYHQARGLDTSVHARHPAALPMALTVPSGTAIYTAAKEAGIEIPVLCHDER